MFKRLFSPLKVGSVEIPNRLVVSPMVTDYCNQDGTATERYIAYHEAKAKVVFPTKPIFQTIFSEGVKVYEHRATDQKQLASFRHLQS